MKEIPLTKGCVALVDDEDYERVSASKWFRRGERRDGRYYAAAKRGGRMIYLHRFIMNAPPNKKVDHINGDTLDNRRTNLRLCTQRDNLRNSRGHRSGEKLLGTTRARSGRYRAQRVVGGKVHYLGTFDTREEAHQAYLKEESSPI